MKFGLKTYLTPRISDRYRFLFLVLFLNYFFVFMAPSAIKRLGSI